MMAEEDRQTPVIAAYWGAAVGGLAEGVEMVLRVSAD